VLADFCEFLETLLRTVLIEFCSDSRNEIAVDKGKK